MEVLLSSPRGFCAGVVRAIDVVDVCLRRYGPPVYVKHQIVHNPYVVNDLESRGAITVEEVDEVPEGSLVVFSAHGSPPEDFDKARPATCASSTPSARWSPVCTTRPRNTAARGVASCWWGTGDTRRSGAPWGRLK